MSNTIDTIEKWEVGSAWRTPIEQSRAEIELFNQLELLSGRLKKTTEDFSGAGLTVDEGYEFRLGQGTLKIGPYNGGNVWLLDVEEIALDEDYSFRAQRFEVVDRSIIAVSPDEQTFCVRDPISFVHIVTT